MRKLRGWIFRFGGFFNRQHKDHELSKEIESHLQMHVEDNVRSGMLPEEARREALIKLGGVEPTKEAYRDQRGLPVLETLWQDIRYGARMLRKNLGFTAVAVLTRAIAVQSGECAHAPTPLGERSQQPSRVRSADWRQIGFVEQKQQCILVH